MYAEFSWILLLQCIISLWHYSLKLCLVLSYKVADADSSIKNLEKEADRLLDKIKPIKELQDNLGKNISQIKELINQARKQANSVSPISQKKIDLLSIDGILFSTFYFFSTLWILPDSKHVEREQILEYNFSEKKRIFWWFSLCVLFLHLKHALVKWIASVGMDCKRFFLRSIVGDSAAEESQYHWFVVRTKMYFSA